VYGGDFAGKRDIVTRDRLTKDPSPHHYFAADHRQTVSNMLVPNWKRRMSSSSSSQPTHFGHRKLVRSQETISSGFQNLVTSRRTVSKATNSKPELLSSLTRNIHAFCMASNIESLLLSANNWWMFNVRSAFGICFTLTFYALKLQRLADYGAKCLVARSGFRRRLLGAP
jgi:hypothetical protein